MNNKKIKYLYAILIIIGIIMLVSNGVSNSIIINSYNDYLDKGIIDGFSGEKGIYIINLLYVLLSIILNTIITFKKLNSIRTKYIFFFSILIINLFITIGFHNYSGGFAGISETENIYLWNLPLLFK